MTGTVRNLLFSSSMVQLGGMAATLLVGIQLARNLGPANYGIYGVILAAVAVLAVPAQFGLPLFAVREAAGAISSRAHAGFRSVVIWFLIRSVVIAAVIVTTLAVALLSWSPPWIEGRGDFVGYAAMTVVTLSLLASLTGLVRGAGKNVQGQAPDALVRPLMTSVLLFAASYSLGKVSVSLALALQLASILVAVSVATVTLGSLYRAAARSALVYAPQNWAKTALTFASTSMLQVLNANYPILVAGLLVAAADVGVFRVALSSVALVALPTAITNIAVGPLIAKLHSEKGDRLEEVLSHSTLAAFAATAAMMCGLALFGRPLIGILFGDAYLGAFIPLMLLGGAQLVVAAFGVAGTYLNMTGREALVIRAFMIAVPAGLLISVPLTKFLGINGAALSSLVMVSIWHWHVFFRHKEGVAQGLTLASAVRFYRRSRAGGGKSPNGEG